MIAGGNRLLGVAPAPLGALARRITLPLLTVVAGFAFAIWIGLHAPTSPDRVIQLSVLTFVGAAFVTGQSIWIVVLALPAAWAIDRLPGTGGALSESDAMLLLASILALLNLRSRAGVIGPLLVPLAIFQGLMLLAVVHAPTVAGFTEWFHRLLLVGGSMLVGAYLYETGRLELSLRLFVAATLVVALVVGYEAVHSGWTSQGIYPLGIQKNYAGILLALAAIIVYAWPRPLIGGSSLRYPIAGILFVALFLTHSRGSLIGLGAALASLALLPGKGAKGVDRRGVFTLLLAAGIIGLIAQLISVELPIESKNVYGPVGQRQEMQAQAMVIWNLNPILGGGLRFYENAINLPNFWLHSDPHNVVILTLAESGIVGLAAFAILLGGALMRLRGTEHELAPIAFALTLALLAYGMLEVYWLHGSQVMPWTLAGAALAGAAGTVPARRRHPAARPLRLTEAARPG